MKHTIPAYDTYANAEADLDNLLGGQVISVDETLRLYRVVDGTVKSLEPITNGANMSLSGTVLTITY